MNATVFVSGSRAIRELPEAARVSLDKITQLGWLVLVGDCSGADTLVQAYLEAKGYTRVKVYHLGAGPRHCLGFASVWIDGARQSDEDQAMAALADYGLAIWDGKSPGTSANIKRVKRTKVIRV